MDDKDTAPNEHRGQRLQCPVCSGREFSQREYAVRTIEDEMFRQPWAVDEIKAYVCTGCGHILWFV